MTPHTYFENKEKLLNSLYLINNDIFETYTKTQNAMISKGYVVGKNTYHFIKEILETKTKESSTEAVYRKMLLNIISNAEKTSGLSSEILFLMCVNAMKNHTIFNNNIGFTSTEDFEKIISQNTQTINRNSLEQQIKNLINDEILIDVILRSIELGGIEAKIYINNGKNDNFIIEKKSGFYFSAQPFKFFLSTLGSWENRNCKILIIDGMIEQVSELDHLLNRSMETQIPLVLVARGFSEEVIATLKLNFDKQILNVIPVKIPTDINSINILNDIACTTNSKVISSISGDLISLTSWDDLNFVNKIICNTNQIIIEESKYLKSVNLQLQMLLEKRMSNIEVEDIVDIIDKRIRSLSNNSIIISLPNVSQVENESYRAKIDIALRFYKTIFNYGIINYDDVLEAFKKENLNLYKFFKDIKLQNPNIPSLSFLISYKLLCGFMKTLTNSGGIILLEEQPCSRHL